jgi:precorrin-2 C20-methyltransferase/precorrin-3B C17-methyltransferase
VSGHLYGVGVGPGDPELVTLKAARIIAGADVIAYPGKEHGASRAREIVDVRPEQIELHLRYPVTTGKTDHPGGYEGAMADFYDACAAELATHLDAGRDVAVLCEGDPFLYGSYMYLHDRLAARYETTVIPGVTSFSAAAAAAGTPLVRRDDVLTILPGTLGTEALAARLEASDAAVVMKSGRTFGSIRAAVEQAGLLDRGVYVERASTEHQRVAPLAEVDEKVPYMSLVLVPALGARKPDGHEQGQEQGHGQEQGQGHAHGQGHGQGQGHEHGQEQEQGHVTVVGLGPAGPEWLTPEASAALSAAEVLIGYDTYLARVPTRPGQLRYPTDNRVEAERARHALELAAAGTSVAVVSSGDPGIFAMAAAVIEEAADYPGVSVRVVPGLSAMQAVAARVGAPLGHDFAVISLSDQLKPAEVVAARLAAAAGADLVLALYNPASKTRREGLARAIEVLLEVRAPETPVVVARAVGAPDESVTLTTLGALDQDAVDMRTLLIVGSSQTVVRGSQMYTPRTYPAMRDA